MSHSDFFQILFPRLSASTEDVCYISLLCPVSLTGLVQRCVIIQKDENGFGLTVSGDNPVFVQLVKEGEAKKGRGDVALALTVLLLKLVTIKYYIGRKSLFRKKVQFTYRYYAGHKMLFCFY